MAFGVFRGDGMLISALRSHFGRRLAGRNESSPPRTDLRKSDQHRKRDPLAHSHVEIFHSQVSV